MHLARHRLHQTLAPKHTQPATVQLATTAAIRAPSFHHQQAQSMQSSAAQARSASGGGMPEECRQLLDRSWTAASSLYLQELVPRFTPWLITALQQLLHHAYPGAIAGLQGTCSRAEGEEGAQGTPTGLPAGLPVVVPCCGPGHELPILSRALHHARPIIGIDLSQGMIALAQTLAQADALLSRQPGQTGAGAGVSSGAAGAGAATASGSITAGSVGTIVEPNTTTAAAGAAGAPGTPPPPAGPTGAAAAGAVTAPTSETRAGSSGGGSSAAAAQAICRAALLATMQATCGCTTCSASTRLPGFAAAAPGAGASSLLSKAENESRFGAASSAAAASGAGPSSVPSKTDTQTPQASHQHQQHQRQEHATSAAGSGPKALVVEAPTLPLMPSGECLFAVGPAPAGLLSAVVGDACLLGQEVSAPSPAVQNPVEDSPGPSVVGERTSAGRTDGTPTRQPQSPPSGPDTPPSGPAPPRVGTLPPAGSAAAVLSLFGLQQLGPLAPKALESWARCLAPGGVLVVVLWPTSTEEVGPWAAWGEAIQVVQQVEQKQPSWAQQQQKHRGSKGQDQGQLQAWEVNLLSDALQVPGCTLLEDRPVSHPMCWPSAGWCWEVMTQGGPWHARRLAFGDAAMEDLRRAWLGVLAQQQQQRQGAGPQQLTGAQAQKEAGPQQRQSAEVSQGQQGAGRQHPQRSMQVSQGQQGLVAPPPGDQHQYTNLSSATGAGLSPGSGDSRVLDEVASAPLHHTPTARLIIIKRAAGSDAGLSESGQALAEAGVVPSRL